MFLLRRMGPGTMPGPIALLLLVGALAAAQPSPAVRHPSWAELASVRPSLAARGITPETLARFLGQAQDAHAVRVREGDLDHLIFYMLQSARFTRRPPIEPALSARTFVEGLTGEQRAMFLSASAALDVTVPPEVQGRIRDLLSHVARPSPDERRTFFRQLVDTAFPDASGREAALGREYVRAMRFLYRKEFVAPRGAAGAAAVQDLYRERGLSTDTAIEAGFVVHTGLAVLKALEPARRVRRVLVVGPGLDLAPRTGLLEEAPPQSYQPWAVMDALVSLGLSRFDDLSVVCADINPRVVDHLQRMRARPPSLRLASALSGDALTLSGDYLDYVERLGNAIASSPPPAALPRAVEVNAASAQALAPAVLLDIVTERLDRPGFDLVVATNILPYFDDVQLALAMSNIASMTAPGGVLLHNEGRPILGDITTAVGIPFEQARHVTIATVRGATAPLADSVYLHRRTRTAR